MSKRPKSKVSHWIVRGVGFMIAPLILAIVIIAANSSPMLGQGTIESKTNLPADLSNVYALYEQDVIELKFKDNQQMRLRAGAPRMSTVARSRRQRPMP